jgi:probable HAF family extracellular repeat protein
MLALGDSTLRAQTPQYSILQVNVGVGVEGKHLNNLGQVAGVVGNHAVLTRPNAAFNPATDYLDFTTRPTYGFSVNDLGEAAGYIDLNDGTQFSTRGTHSQPNAPFDLSQVNFGNNLPRAINNSGATTGPGANGYAFRSSNDGQALTITSLGSLGAIATGGGNASFGLDINDSGVVTGWSGTGMGSIHAFRTAGATMIPATDDLGVLGTGDFSQGQAINNAGVVVGYSNLILSGNIDHAFRAVPGQAMQDLGTLGGSNAVANGINNQGWIVGASEVFPGFDGRVAFLWRDGQMINLNLLINPAHPYVFERAIDINDAGQILVSSSGGNYLLTPIPEPSTFILLLAGIGTCIVLKA